MSDFQSTTETDVGVIKLRTIATDADALLTRALGFSPPLLGAVRTRHGVYCARVGPHEWLMIGANDALGETHDRLAAAFDGARTLLIDMSHGSHVLRFEGPGAIDRINAYCDLDLEAFSTGAAGRTRFGDIPIVLVRLDDRPTFWLIADQSYADYLDLLVRHGALTG